MDMPWELDPFDSYIPHKTTSGITGPPELPVRASAEWEEIDALWSPGPAIPIPSEIVRYAQEDARCIYYVQIPTR